jgi:hypothetical protein
MPPIQHQTEDEYRTLSPDELVNQLAYKANRNLVIRALVGALTATEMRRVRLTDTAHEALINGLRHTNPKVRWWCLQLLDHMGEARSVPSILPLLQDPVPRVRKHAHHALTCERCKPSPEIAQAIQRAVNQHPGY